jgi:hypothetical protein
VAHRPRVALQRVLLKLASTVHPDEVPDVKDWARRDTVPCSTWLSTLALRAAGTDRPAAAVARAAGAAGAAAERARGGADAHALLRLRRYRLAAAPALWIPRREPSGKSAGARSRRGALRLAIAGGGLLAAGLLVAAGRVPLRADAGVQAAGSMFR